MYWKENVNIYMWLWMGLEFGWIYEICRSLGLNGLNVWKCMFGTFEWNFEFENWFTKMLSCNWINGYVIDVLLVKWLKNDKMDLKYGN